MNFRPSRGCGCFIVYVIAGTFPIWTLLALATIPIVLKILSITRRSYDDIPGYAPAILMTVKTFALSTVLIGVGFVLQRLIPLAI